MRLPRAILPAVCALGLILAAPAFGAGSITTVAGPGVAGTPGDGGPATQAYTPSPLGIAALPDGSYLFTHQGNSAVRRVLPDGTISTFAGNGTSGYSGDGGPATSAMLDAPSAVVAAPDGGYLIADPNNNVVRRVAPDGTISTVAGVQALGAGFAGDGGPATSAQLSFPFDLAFLPDGSYLIADKDNARIRRVDTSGNISTVAGGGGALGDDGPATSAQLIQPWSVTATPDGGYLIGDRDHNRIRKVDAGGTITTVAGNGTAGAGGDGGQATAAELDAPGRTVLAPGGGFLIAEDTGARVRRVAPDGTISTIAGTTTGFSGDGGPATQAQLNRPQGLAFLPSGDILVVDALNNRIRFIDEETPPPTLTGSSPASPASDSNPRVLGSAPAGTTVALFTSADCSGDSVAGGTAADLTATGIAVPVANGSTTTFRAVTIDLAGNRSACSPTSVTYRQGTQLPAPVQGRKMNVVPEKGQVLVKVPGGKFVPLATLGRQIPVGATLDTRKGTVRLTSANLQKPGGTQVGHFSKGIFKLGQTRKNPLTTLSMVGGGLNACSRLPRGGSPKQAAGAAKRKRHRTLFSNVKGRFRTRGRNSAATVRGTQWTMTDTCKGTRTTVARGSVTVQDFTLRKRRVVRAGHTYFARVPGKKNRRA